MLIGNSRLKGEISEIESKIDQLIVENTNVEELQLIIDALHTEQIREEKRYFDPDNVDPAGFGLVVKRLIQDIGLQTQAQKIMDNNDIDFVVSGDVYGFLLFLQSTSEAAKYLPVSYLSLNRQGEKSAVRANFRINYAVLDDTPTRELTPKGEILDLQVPETQHPGLDRIVQLFAGQREVPNESPVSINDEKSRPSVRADWLRHIGTVTIDRNTFTIFKDTRSNRIYRLQEDTPQSDGWSYVEYKDGKHYLRKDDTIYVVFSEVE